MTFVAISDDAYFVDVAETSFTLRTFLLNVAAFLTSALVLISALAWNDAAREYLKRYPALKKRGMWVYALIVTGIAFVAITAVMWLKAKTTKEEEKEAE